MPLTRNVAVTSLGINVGIDGTGRSTATWRLNSGDVPGACDAITWWNKARGRVIRGLRLRRAEERALLFALPALALLAGAQTLRCGGWKTRAATAEAMAADYARAAELRAESDPRQQSLREAAARLDHDLSMEDGTDAPLSD